MDPANDSPFPGASAEAPQPVSNKPVAVYFDAIMHAAVQRLHNLGLWIGLGPEMGDMVVRIRPFYHPEVIAAREAVEREIKYQFPKMYRDGKKDLAGEHLLKVNRAAVAAAITGAKAMINIGKPHIESRDPGIMTGLADFTDAMRAKAKEHGIPVVDGEAGIQLVQLTGRETGEQAREALRPLLEISQPILDALFGASQTLQSAKDEEIYAKGEAYVYGLDAVRSWGASAAPTATPTTT